MDLKFKLNQIANRFTEITFEEEISDELLNKRLQVIEGIQTEFSKEIIEIRSSFRTICIQWDKRPETTALAKWLKNFQISIQAKTQRTWQIPVCYDKSLGTDLPALAESKNLSTAQIIELHSSAAYKLHFFGFLPGFMYLSGLDPVLANPRKKFPERSIQAGSVAIGGDQTGIYPGASPGGWHVIGRTVISFFDAKAEKPVWANPGDSIKFKPISLREFENSTLTKTNPILL